MTKSFQSLRDLVNKVGSFIGGESKEEEHGEHGEHAAPNRPADAPAEASGREAEHGRRAEPANVPAPASEARAEAPAESPQPQGEDEEVTLWSLSVGDTPAAEPEPFNTDADTSFADLGADDEMIETRPADAFGSHARHDTRPEAASPARPPASTEAAFDDRAHDAREAQTPSVHEPSPSTAGFSPVASEVLEPEPFEAEPPRAFAARAAAASTADDSLLDLGGFGPSASASSAEADDFILDLADEPHAPSSAAPQGFNAGVWAESPSSSSGAGVDEAARPDEAGAFAEAAHGDAATPDDFFDFDLTPQTEAQTREPARALEAVGEDAAPRLGEAATRHAENFETREHDSFESLAADASANAGLSEIAAPRGFVEPTVVPATEPVPATFEGEFTDGSVEGDLPKPPVGVSPDEVEAEASPAADSDARPYLAAEPSTAGHAVGMARAGVEERAGQLSREEIEAVARRVVEIMSDKVVREIAWEVVPDLAELLVKRKLEEERGRQ